MALPLISLAISRKNRSGSIVISRIRTRNEEVRIIELEAVEYYQSKPDRESCTGENGVTGSIYIRFDLIAGKRFRFLSIR